MAVIRIDGGDVTLPRNIAFLDTNVVVARFDVSDSLHSEALLTLEEDDRFEWVVTGPVIVEASGMLLKRTNLVVVFEMLRWLVTPGNKVYVLTCAEGPNEHEMRLVQQSSVMESRGIDFVDAYLMRIASLIAVSWKVPFMPIVTSDGRDFFSTRGMGFRYGVIDLRDPGGGVIPVS